MLSQPLCCLPELRGEAQLCWPGLRLTVICAVVQLQMQWAEMLAVHCWSALRMFVAFVAVQSRVQRAEVSVHCWLVLQLPMVFVAAQS